MLHRTAGRKLVNLLVRGTKQALVAQWIRASDYGTHYGRSGLCWPIPDCPPDQGKSYFRRSSVTLSADLFWLVRCKMFAVPVRAAERQQGGFAGQARSPAPE